MFMDVHMHARHRVHVWPACLLPLHTRTPLLFPPSSVPAQESAKAREVFHDRTFDGNKIKATFVSEEEFSQAQADVWLPSKPAPAPAAAAATAPTVPLSSMLPGSLTALGFGV